MLRLAVLALVSGAALAVPSCDERLARTQRQIVELRASLRAGVASADVADRALAGLDDIVRTFGDDVDGAHAASPRALAGARALRRPSLPSGVAAAASDDDNCTDDGAIKASTYDDLSTHITGATGSGWVNLALQNDIDFTDAIEVDTKVTIHSGSCNDATQYALSGNGVTRIFRIKPNAFLILNGVRESEPPRAHANASTRRATSHAQCKP